MYYHFFLLTHQILFIIWTKYTAQMNRNNGWLQSRVLRVGTSWESTGDALEQTSLMLQLINSAKNATYVCPLCRHFEHTCDKCEHYSEQKFTQLIWWQRHM